jgi:hypothetical protein
MQENSTGLKSFFDGQYPDFSITPKNSVFLNSDEFVDCFETVGFVDISRML